MSSFEFTTEPYPHQRKTFEESRRLTKYAIFWEMGLGKSKLILDTAADLYQQGEINTLFVIAPNGVHRNWVVEELAVHLPPDLLKKTFGFAYFSSKAKNKSHIAGAKKAANHKGFVVVAMSYDAFITNGGKKFAQSVLKKRECLYVLDESTRIGNPKSKRTRAILGSAKYGKYRRILTGTPVADGPFKIYSQLRFLDIDYWKEKGLGTYSLFTNYFGEFYMIETNGRSVSVLKHYKNLDELKEIIAGDSSRITKEVLGLPDKLYSKRFFEMTSKQSKLYKKLCDEYMVEIEKGLTVMCELPIVRMLRLQQIASGFVKAERESLDETGRTEEELLDANWLDTNEEIIELVAPEKNPRLRLLMDIIEDVPGKAIIWARFTRDIDLIMDRLKSQGMTAVRYDGGVTDDDRAIAIDSFQHGAHDNARFFVANQAAASTGLTLTAATTVIYYTNDFSLERRLQSEDRAHRIGTKYAVTYIDLQAIGTIDVYVTDTLRGKKDVSTMLLGDTCTPWL